MSQARLIIREGEWGGNSFFILVEGKLDVYIEAVTQQCRRR